MQTNTLMALNNHLYEQMERLNDDELSDEGLAKEVTRAKSMTDISQKIIENARLALDAEKFRAEYGEKTVVLPKMIG